MLPSKNIFHFLFVVIFLSFSNYAFSQFSVTPSNNELDPETLVKTIFLGDGVEVSNVVYNGQFGSVGYFTDAQDEIGINRGIVLSSGNVIDVNNEESTLASTGTTGPANDEDLENLANLALNDLVTYEITFIPVNDTLRFKYVFASEEYPTYICSAFNDVFGFFLTGPNPAGGVYDGENIALVPDPADPTGETFTNDFVSINNVHPTVPACPASYEMYYNDNDMSLDLVHGAYLDVFTAMAIVTPCEEYTIKLAISDVGDGILDSGVFLEAKSFGTGSVNLDIQTVSLDGSIAEGCDPGSLIFTLPKPPTTDYSLDLTIVECDSASAVKNVDYVGLPNKIVFPAGVDSIGYEIYAVQDGVTEGVEAICFEIQRDVCNVDTVSILIRESPIQDPILPQDTMVCEEDIITLYSDLPPSFVLPDPLVFTYDQNYQITDNVDESQPLPLNVSGVQPEYLVPGMIRSVCIDSLSARYLTDYDIYLQAPGGQFVELSTDNGYKPMNGLDLDTMINTCFTPFALDNINNGNETAGPFFAGNPNYTGEFYPEGVWEDLYDGENPANGTWKLIIIDDEAGGNVMPIITGWSITFNPLYFLSFEWSSDVDGVLCENCITYDDVVLEDKTYYLNMYDSYGCSTIDSFDVEVVPLLDSTEFITCDSVSLDFISINWDDVLGATGFEISVNGGPFVDVGDVNTFNISGLDPDTGYTFEIRPTGGLCGGRIASHTCYTPNCLIDQFVEEDKENLECSGETDGLIDVLVTGTFPPYTYELNGETNSDGLFTDLPGGTDTIYITDDVGCVSPFVFTIEEPETISSDFINTGDISCFGQIDGTAEVLTGGGTEPFTYQWETGETGEIAIMLEQGWNSVTIEDANGCIKVDSLLIDEPSEITSQQVSQPPSCFGGDDGVAFINPSGGSGNFTFLWSDPMNQETQQAGNLSAGIYQVTVTDDSGCIAVFDVEIEEGEVIETTAVGEDIACAGDTNGKGYVSVNNPGTFTYEWSNGEMQDTAYTLPQGWNYVTVTGNGCSIVDSVFIDAANEIVIDHFAFDVACNGDATGIVELLITGDNQPFTINLDGIEVTSPIGGLEAGEHCFSITDALDCNVQYCVTIAEPDAITFDSDVFNETCFGSENGSVNINDVEGGVGPFDFNWTGPSSFTSNNNPITGLGSGPYFVTITDQNQCEVYESFVLEPADSVSVEFLSQDLACFNDESGFINTTILSGTEPFNFNWSGPNGFTSDDQNLGDLEAGNYFVEIMDSTGCTILESVSISQPDSIVLNISGIDSICYDATNGIANINPTGGVGNFTIEWSNGSTATNINSLESGSYSVTVMDENFCTNEASTEVIERGELIIELSQTSSLCRNSKDGSATIEAILEDGISVPIDQFDILWNSNPNQTTSTADGLTGGSTYSVIVTDQYNCTAVESITIDNPEQVSVNPLEVIDPDCSDAYTGLITIEGEGGVDPYTFEWGQNSGFQVGSTASDLDAGTYVVTVTDANGCTSINSFELIDPLPISTNFRVFDVLCNGDETGEIEVIASGGMPPYNMDWSTGDDEDEISNLASGEYYLTLTDDQGCERIDTVLIEEPDPINIDASTQDVTCFESEDGRIFIDASGGAGLYSYSIDDYIYNGSSEQIGLAPGMYTVYVKDKNGCIDSLPFIEIPVPDSQTVDLGENVSINYDEEFLIIPTITNYTAPISYEWDADYDYLLSCLTCTTTNYQGLQNGYVTLYIIDQFGCIGEDKIFINIEEETVAYVPTAFTPNNDFNNDVLHVFGREGIQINSFRIFDRWGELVFEAQDFETNDTSIGWDGTHRGNEMNSGTFIWTIEVESDLGQIETYHGSVTLIR